MSTATTSDGVTIGYDAAGQGTPAIVFVHGWCCDRTSFAPQVDHFTPHRRVIALDLRGHGRSSAASSYRIDDFADDVRAVIAAERLGRPVVVGHSMGSLVALALAAGGDGAAAVMIDPSPIVGPRKTKFGDLARGAFARDVDGTARRAFVETIFLPSDDQARRQRIVDAIVARPLDVALPGLLAIEGFDGATALRACAVPLLSIGAAGPANATADLAASCQHIQIGQTVGAGHFNQLEVPDQVNAMIDRFLVLTSESRVDGSRRANPSTHSAGTQAD